MTTQKLTEYWMRGPVPGITPLLQPVAHALLQAQDEIHAMMTGFPDALLWKPLAVMASTGFHLQHLVGVQDRLFTYARGEALNPQQLHYLASEGQQPEAATLSSLLEAFDRQTAQSMLQLEATSPETLTELRVVGRLKLESTVIGLLFHAAEHTMRHTGQLLVTSKAIRM